MEWKRIVRYMYEYENDRKLRNTGFIRFDLSEKICKAYIHGKGIHEEDICNIYAFYESDEAVIRIPLGYVRMRNGNLDGYVEMNPEHIGDTDVPFDRIMGLMIGENRDRRYLVLLKNERFPGSIRDMEKPQKMEEKTEMEKAETAAAENNSAEKIVAESDNPGTGIQQPDNPTSEPEVPEDLPPETEETIKKEFGYRRIGPRDLGMLKRRDRHLTNNSFLLHGYYNYQHLILAEDEEHYILGVPGVYMEREKRAAMMFGFPEFLEAEEYGIPVPMEAREQKAAFGYWCRRLEKNG